MPSWKLIALLATALTLLVAGCGSSTLDTAKIEDEVQELAEDEDIEVDKVSCPDDIEPKEGDEFECEIETEDNIEIEADVEQTNDDGDVRVRISSSEIAKAKGGGEAPEDGGATDTQTEAAPPADDGGGAAPSGEDADLVMQAIRSFVTAARDGDAATFCGQQTDRRLAERYGSIEECVESDEATTPAPNIPSGDDIDITIESIDGNQATAEVDEKGGDSTGSPYTLVKEAGEGGWAVDTIDGE